MYHCYRGLRLAIKSSNTLMILVTSFEGQTSGVTGQRDTGEKKERKLGGPK